MYIKEGIIIAALSLLTACSADEIAYEQEPVNHEFTLTSEVVPFIGEDATTRSKLDGTGFEDGDWIRLKIICPFVDGAEYGESTWSGSYDAFFLLKKSGSSWIPLSKDDHCDIDGDYVFSASPNPNSFYEAQQTPYVYMASTWSEEKSFRTGTNGSRYVLQYCHVFHADQRKEENYKASDLLWAQQYMQTGSWNVHLTFEHKMACIAFTIDDTELSTPLSGNAVLTLEGMPDIDQQEIIVGDYYAERSKINSAGNYNYKNKHSCNYEYNGRVIGIGVNVDASIDGALDGGGQLAGNRAYAWPMSGNPNPAYNNQKFAASKIIPNAGTYTAYKVKESNTSYRLIVPPCALSQKARIWVRDGERRYMMLLDRLDFYEGELYPIKVTLKNE